jgi:hypothetical protein
MDGTQPRLSSLEVRKQLLIVESEVNRTRLEQTWLCLRRETDELTRQARATCSTLVSTASVGIAGFKAFRKLRATQRSANGSWLANLAEGMRLGSALWTTFRSHLR